MAGLAQAAHAVAGCQQLPTPALLQCNCLQPRTRHSDASHWLPPTALDTSPRPDVWVDVSPAGQAGGGRPRGRRQCAAGSGHGGTKRAPAQHGRLQGKPRLDDVAGAWQGRRCKRQRTARVDGGRFATHCHPPVLPSCTLIRTPCFSVQDRFLVEALAVGPQVQAATSELFRAHAADVRCACWGWAWDAALVWAERLPMLRSGGWGPIVQHALLKQGAKILDWPSIYYTCPPRLLSPCSRHSCVQRHKAKGGRAGAKDQGRRHRRQHTGSPPGTAAHANCSDRRLGSQASWRHARSCGRRVSSKAGHGHTCSGRVGRKARQHTGSSSLQ